MNTTDTNFHSSDNDTVEPPIARTRTLSELKRKRRLKAIVFIVAILLVVASIVVPATILLTRESYTGDNATTTTMYITQTSIKTAASSMTKSAVSQAIAVTTTTPTPSTSVTTTVTTNRSGPPSTACTAGLLNNQFGIHKAYGYENVTASAIWLADQKSVPGSELKLQTDRNLMVYGNSEALWGTGTHNGGPGRPFCLKLLESGNLLWIDKNEAVLWETRLDSLYNVL